VHSTINNIAAVPQQYVPLYLPVSEHNLPGIYTELFASDQDRDSLNIYGFIQVLAQTTASDILIFNSIYLLTAIGLSPGGSSTVHIYTQTINRTTQK